VKFFLDFFCFAYGCVDFLFKFSVTSFFSLPCFPPRLPSTVWQGGERSERGCNPPLHPAQTSTLLELRAEVRLVSVEEEEVYGRQTKFER